jgi:putative membrane protein
MIMLTRDAVLAYAHFICIFTLASLLVGELILLRKTLPPDLLRRLQAIDRWYGIVAGLVVVSGLARLFLGVKGAAFYTHNPVFWTKMGLFVAVALISIVPTIAYVRWNARRSADGSIVLGDAEFTRLRGTLWLQVVLFLFIPLCAAFMARGFWYVAVLVSAVR